MSSASSAFAFPIPTPKHRAQDSRKLLEMVVDVGDISILGFACRARNHFDLTFRNLLANIDSEGDTDQIGILELNPGTLIAIVQEHGKASLFQLLRDLLRRA